MRTFYWQRLMAAFIAIALLIAPPALVQAAETQALAQQLRSDQVTGTLPGGEFAKVWLALEPNFPEADIRVLVEWDRPNAADNGLFFVVLDPVGLNQVLSGSEVRNVALSQGNPVFEGSDNQMEARFTAFGLTTYTLVIGNDSNEPASFLVTVENAVIVDDSDQVEDPNATTDTEAADTGDADAEDAADADDTADTTSTDAAADVTATTTTTVTATTTDTTAAETTAVTATTTDTTPAETTAVTATTTDTTPAGTTTTSVATTGEPGEVRSTEMEGQLEQDETHYLGLEPSEPDGDIQLILTFDPQDDSEVARRTNMLVLNASDLGQISSSTRPSDLAIAAGNRVFGGASNERRASFQASGLGEYVVLVTNTSTKLVDYDLTVDGGILFDDSGQTQTAQATVTATSTTTATVRAVDEDGAATTAAADEDSAASTTTTTAAREGTPGGVYVVQSGDTLSLIARDIYSDLNLYDELCAFNNLTNCDRIEVGDEIQLPTTAQLGDIDTSTTATTTTTEAADAEDATDDAAEDEADITATDTSTSTATTTQNSTATSSTTGSANSSDTAASLSSSDESDIVETLQSSDDFELLYAAIDAADLEEALRGPGPFTLFAPTDAAFSALPDGALDTLLEDPGGQLTTILLYHVVPGRLTADGISDGLNAQTVEGRTVQFGVNGDDVTINDANVVIQGIESSNGIIHVIDAVISPSVTTSSANTNSSSGTAGNTNESAADSEASSTDSDDASTETTDATASDQQSVIDNLPVLADASDLTSSTEGGNATVSYKTESSIADAAAFYNEQMPLLGFDSTRSTVTDDAATLAFSDDSSDIQVSITPDTAAGDVLITITVVEA